jgi:hemolysin III
MTLLSLREPISAWSHLTWLLLALPATLLLVYRSRGNRAKQVSLLIFGGSLVICYAASALFHSVRLPLTQIDPFDRLDHIGIYVLIAGSYTPLAWNLMHGRWKWATLAGTWMATAAGTALVIGCGIFPPLTSTSLYLVLGWAALFCYYEISRALTHRPLRLLVLGGILYSIGAVINLLNWPALWPGVFGAHELFHLFVMGGSLAHFWFMLTVVAPYRPPLEPVPCSASTASGRATVRSARRPAATQFARGRLAFPAWGALAALFVWLRNNGGFLNRWG